jgi:hypothetical protein
VDGKAFAAEPTAVIGVGARPDTLDFLQEKISIGPGGDALVEVTAVLAKGGSGDLLLPFDFEGGGDFTVLAGPIRFHQTPAGPERPVREVLGYHMLNLVTEATAAAGDTVRVRALVPGWYDRQDARQEYGEFQLGRKYVNTSKMVFRSFNLALQLPEGMLVHSVTRVIPGYDPKKSPEPPYAIGRSGDRGWARLQQANLLPAGNCLLEMNIRPHRRGPIPLVLGLLAGAAYLVFFRDVLKAKETE